jgi:hypothetical protein
MACDVHKELLGAVHRQTLALDSGSQHARSMSIKRQIQERSDTKLKLQLAEDKYNTHIASCARCLSDGRSAFRISDVKE